MADFTGFPKLDTPFVQADEKRPAAARIIAIPWYQLLVEVWTRTGGGDGYVNGENQPGAMIAWAGTGLPVGYLEADAASVAVVDYPDLFDAIGYAWGGVGASFNVPPQISALVAPARWIIRAY